MKNTRNHFFSIEKVKLTHFGNAGAWMLGKEAPSANACVLSPRPVKGASTSSCPARPVSRALTSFRKPAGAATAASPRGQGPGATTPRWGPVGNVHRFCGELFLGKAAHINISKCHLWISSLKHCVTYLVTVKAQSPIFKSWWDSRCLPSKQKRGRCRRVLKPELADLIISGLSQIDVMSFQLILFQDCFSFTLKWSKRFAWLLDFEVPSLPETEQLPCYFRVFRVQKDPEK